MRASLACLLMTLLALPATAGAQGVVVDPDSPTGKEYAIPLEAARRAADDSSGSLPSREGQAPVKAPLFGEGITPSPTGAGGRVTPGAGTSGRAGEAEAPESSSVRPGRVRPLDVATARPGAPDGGVSLALFGAAGLAVLLVGGAAGWAIRRSAA